LPPTIRPITAPAAAGATTFSVSFSFVAGASREIVAVLIAVRPAPGVSSWVKRIATMPRPLTLPGRSAAVTCPLTTVPAGSTSAPATVTARRRRPVTGCSTRLVSEPTAVSRSTGSTVPAGSVTSWYAAPPSNAFLTGLLGVVADAAAVASAPLVGTGLAPVAASAAGRAASPDDGVAVSWLAAGADSGVFEHAPTIARLHANIVSRFILITLFSS
jgi:hypothetical protein